MHSNDDVRASAPMPMPGPSRGYDRERDRRRSRRSRHGSPSSSDAMSLSSSSSSSYLEISRWYPSYGRSGGVLNAFFKTPSEHKQRVRRRRSLKKKNRGIFGFGNNSSSSSVNSDMAYGMGFVRKPKSRNFSPRGERAPGLERSDARPAQAQRRQTDEEILEIGRKLAKVARDSNREDVRAMGKRQPSQFSAAQDTWDKYSRQNSGGYAASSRGIAPSKHDRHSSSSTSDDEWESASEGEYSSDESNSGLAYGAAVDLGRASPPKSSVSRQSTYISARPPEDIRPPDRKSSAVDPRLFGPVNSLRGLINTPCGYGDRNSAYTVPGPSEQRYAGSAGTAESASIEARPMQTVYPVQTSDPSRVDAARASGSLVSSHHSSRRPEPLPIQAPKPIAPVRTSLYDEQRIRDSEQPSPRESRIKPSENKTFAETALVGAGVAALGAAIMAGRDKGKGKEKDRDPEPRHGRHERYGHDDHREEDTVVQDSRRAKELALEKEIERLERALSDRNKAREQRKRDSKRDSAPMLLESRAADVDAERDHEKRRRDRDSRYSEPDYAYERPDTSRRVSEPGERPAAADSGQTGRVEIPAVPSSSGVDVFQFQVPDDAFRTRDSPLRAASPIIIDVTPAPSPPSEEMHRKSRRDSFEDEMRDAKHIYDESMHSTAPISAVDMAAAIAATERARHHDEPERGRTLHKTQDTIQEEANAYYHARRMAEREVSSRSRSKSRERSIVEKYDKDRDNKSKGAEIVRIVTPPEMKQKPQKHKYSEPNADFRFDNLMSPKDLDHFRPFEYQVRDPSAERPRPLLNLVIPTPVPTPTPESQKKKSASSRSPEPVVEEPSREEVPEVVISPRSEVVEAPQTPTSKRVSWGPSETQQYEVESPDRHSERRSRSRERSRSPSRSSGWGATAAAVAGIAAAAALSKDDKPKSSNRDDRSKDSTDAKSSEGSRSPPSRKVLPKGTAPSRVLDDEPEDVPPAPGPKPASPRSSQMPGAFADDLDFAATLAAGLQDTGFDPNIVIEDAAYRRRDSPPGSNEHTGVYMQPYSETVTDLGVIDINDGSRPARESGYVIGELADTSASEKGPASDWTDGSSRRQSKSEKRRSAGSDSTGFVQDRGEEPPKLSKKEQRKIEKAARAAKLAEEEERSSHPVDAGDDDWEEASTSKKSKRSSKKSKRTSLGWDDADTPVNDRRVSVPVDAFDDLDDTKPADNVWDDPQRTSKSKRDSKGYDVVEDPSDRRERRREERRRSDFYEPLDRDVSSVVSDSRHDDRSNGRGRHQADDERSVVSAPDGKRDSKSDKRSSKEEKRSSGGFWGLLKGSNGVDGENQSKKDNAGTLGAGAGVAGAVALASVAAGSLASRSDAAGAPSEQEETRHVIVDVDHPSERRPDSPSRGIDVFDFQDPEITPRVIKPAIDPQYGDLLPLPPSPSEEQKLDFDVSDDLPALPDSRPATPPGQEKLLVREKRDSSQKRPGFAAHSRRRSAYDVPLKSPSHTAIPIAFRMGQRSSIPSSPRVVSNPTSAHQSPAVETQETFSSPSNKRSPRPPSWDRPTSWESTREIKPLYLIERSAQAGADSGGQSHDDSAENTPLPPSRESPAPESVDGGEVEKEERDLEAAPLFVDTAVARTTPLGSQESTPKGVTQTDSGLPDSAREFDTSSKGGSSPSHLDSGLPRSAKDVDMPLMEEPHPSPLLESSYATPTGSPRLESEARPSVQRDESTESISDFMDALDRPALDEDIEKGQDISRSAEEEQPLYKEEPLSVDKQDKPGYISSAISMLPAAGLAGVGALLGRGSRDKTAASVDDHPSQSTQESTAKSVDQSDETSVVPEFEAGQAVTTAPIDLGDQRQVPPAAGASKSGRDTPLDAIEGADVSVPNDSPAAYMRPEETLPISNLQQVADVSRDVKGLEPDPETFVTDDTSATLPPPSTQLPSNDLSASTIPSAEDMETIPETPVDTVEWPEESTPRKKKGKKGKKKQNSIGAASIPTSAGSSARDSSDLQQDTLTREEPISTTIDESSAVPQATTTSPDQALPRQDPGADIEPEFDQGLPKSGETGISSAPYQVLGEDEGQALTDDPQDLPGVTEAPIIPGTLTQSQSQDEEPQVGGRSRRSSSNARRLRSSRSSMSPHGSADRHGSPDVFHSGDDGIVSPPSVSASARSSTGQKYKKTRSLRSSRRSSLASQGSGRVNEPGLSEALAIEQPGTTFGEHQEFYDVEQSSSPQNEGVEQSVKSPLEVMEPQVSSPLNILGEHSTVQPIVHDDPVVKAAGIADDSTLAQPEPLTGDVQRIGSPVVEDSQRGIDLAESSLQESIPPAVEHTPLTSPQKFEEESAGGLAFEPLNESLGVVEPRSSQDPLSSGNEAVQSQSDPVMEEPSAEKLPTNPSGDISQRSEQEDAVHDDLQQKLESLPPVMSVEQTEEPLSSTNVEEPIQTPQLASSPPLEGQYPSELEQFTTEAAAEPELQEPSPILASTEDDNSFTTPKSKKNKKKRKSSTIIGGTVQSPGTTTPAEVEVSKEPAQPSVESSTSRQDDVPLEVSPSTVKETSLELEKQPDNTDLQSSSKFMEPEGDSSKSIEPAIPVSEDKSPIEPLHTSDPTVLPVLDIPSEGAIPELEKPDLGSQEKSGDIPVDEDEIARREAEAELIRDEEAEISKLQSKKKLKPKEKTRLRQLKANADRRAEEAAIVAKPSSPVEGDISEAHIPDNPIQQPVVEESSLPVTEEPILTGEDASTGPSTHITESLPPQLVTGSEEAVPISTDVVGPSEDVTSQSRDIGENSPTSGETLPQLDPSIQERELRPEAEAVEDSEDLARREAEAALIRDEEAELARLESKKKPNKKDKLRMRVLRSNSERRAEEADAAAQLQNEDQGTADLETPLPEDQAGSSLQFQEQDSTREPSSQETREIRTDEPQSFEDAIQASDNISASAHPPVESGFIIPEEDSGATNVEENSKIQPLTQDSIQSQPVTSSGDAMASTGPSHFEDPAEQAERQVELESSRPDDSQADSTQLENAQQDIGHIPQIRVEDTTSSQLDPLPDESHTMDLSESQSRRDSQPQIDETVTDPVQMQPLDDDSGTPGAELETSSQARRDSPALEAQDVATGTQPEETSQGLAQEPVLVSDLTEETGRGTDISSPFGGSEQPAVTVTELPHDPESEWPITSKKSKKDKKKKRKGTISGSSGQDSGTVTPFFDVSEQSPVVESHTLTETMPGSSEDVPQTSSSKLGIAEQGRPSSPTLALYDDRAKDFKMDETMTGQPLEGSIPEQQEISLSGGESVPAPGISDDNTAKDLVDEASAARTLDSSVTEPQEASFRTEGVVPENDKGIVPSIVPQAEPEQAALDEEPEFQIISKKSKKDKKKKRKNTISEDLSLPSGSATPITLDEPEQPSSFAETPLNLEGGQAVLDRSLPLDITEEPARIPSTIEETSATKSPVLETIQSVEEQSLPHSFSEEPSKSPTLGDISTSIPEPEPEPEPEQLAQEEPEFFITKKSKKDKKSKKTLSGTVTPMNDFGAASLPSESAAIQEPDIESTQHPSSPPVAPSEPQKSTSTDLVEDTPMTTEHVEVRSPAQSPETEGIRSTSPLDSKHESPQAGRSGRKSDGWGFLAGAIAGAGVASTIPRSHDKSPERDALPEDITTGESPIQTVGTDTLASRPSFNFADVVETATASDFKDQERSQVSNTSLNQPQSWSFPVEERRLPDDAVQEPKPIHEATSDVITAPEESEEKKPASLNLDSPSDQFTMERDIKPEEVLTTGDFVQDPSNIEEVAADIQGSPREEQTTISELQPQLDDWTQASSSKKKKKKDKKRKSSSTPWSEVGSGAHTPITEEPSEAQDVVMDTNARSKDFDSADLSRPQDNLSTQPEPQPEPELRATEGGNSAPLAGDEFVEQAPLESVLRPGSTEIATDTLATPKLHSTDNHQDETVSETGDSALENLGLGQLQRESHTSDTISSPILDSRVDDRNDHLLTATPLHEETFASTGQTQESSDRPSQDNDGFSRDIGSASTEAFATPLQMPTLTQEVDSQDAPIDDQPLDLSDRRDSGDESAQTGTGPSRSLDLEPELSTSVQQFPAEPADTPVEPSLEPTAEDLWEPIPKKLSKKEKRKAKKGSLSTSVPELTAPVPESDGQQISKEPGILSQRNSPIIGGEPLAQDVDKMDLDRSLEPENEPISIQPPEEQPSQAQEVSVEETPVLSRKMSKKEKRKAKKASLSAWEDDVVEPVESTQSQIPATVETQAQDMPTTSSPTLEPEPVQKEATQTSPSAEPQLEQEVLEDVGISTAKDATAEDEWATPISRKKSKKDKKKKGKQSSSGSISGSQTPAIVEPPILHGVEAAESGGHVIERSGTPDQPADASHFNDRDDRGPPEIKTSSPDNSVKGFGLSGQATEDSTTTQGRKDHRSAELYLPLEGANDEVLSGPSGDADTSHHHRDHRSAELYVPWGERSLQVQEPTTIVDDWDIPSDDQSKNDKAISSRADKTPSLSTHRGGVHHTDERHIEASRTDAQSSKFLRSPDGHGKELEKMQPSPDLWDDEDYFKPKPANFAEPNQEPFSKFDIHPAVARGLNTSPDRRVGEERPLVGLGLIHRHSSIFKEDEGHVPKLLTMASDNVSTDSVAVQEIEVGPSGGSSQLGGLIRSATSPARPSSSRSYDEGLSPAVKQVNTKEYFTFETGPAHGANVPLARSVSPDKFNNLRPVSPGLPRSPQFPPPRSPQLSPQPSPRSPHFPPPSPRSPQYSPRDSSSFEAARDPSKKGSVAALAERFGGAKKATGKTGTVSDYVDNHHPQDDDLFDEPAMWDGAEHEPLRAARLDVDSGDYWAVHETNLEEEQSDPDMQHSGQGAAATSHGREPTTPGSDNVSEPCSQPDIDAGTFTPQIPDQASREAEIPLESVVVESPVLGSQSSVDFPTDEQQPMVKSPRELPDARPDLPESSEDANLHDFLYQPQDSPTPPSRSPVPEKSSSLEEVTPIIEAKDENASVTGPSVVDFSRSMPMGLPSVQEEPHEEEAESSKHVLPAAARAVTPDVNRDSGVVTGSPGPPRVHQFDSGQQQRDSGVHMRDPSGASPRLLGTRAFSPHPARLSHSSIEDEGANIDDKSPKRSSTTDSEAQRRFREATPILEAQDAPITPEPRKNRSKSRKYPDLGPSPGKKAAAAAALAGGGALLAAGATRSRSPSPSPSPAASQRSVSDVTDELRASALPRQRRAASSNTGISRARTPEPLSLRAESPSLLRHSGTPPLRSRRSRSGDLRSLSQLSNRSHSDLGAQASSSPASAVSAANKGPPAHPSPSPASSDLRRATTPAVVAQGTNNPPTANEGRVRSKDMADVYVSQSLIEQAIIQYRKRNPTDLDPRAGRRRRGPPGLTPLTNPTAQHASPPEHAGSRARVASRATHRREPCPARCKSPSRGPHHQSGHQHPR